MPREFGPFHRLQSTTQTPSHAELQEQTSELWGRAPRWDAGGTPQVKAHRGPLPPESRRIEFMTAVEPDSPWGPVYWSGPRPGVRIEGDFAKIRIRVTKRVP